MNIQILLGYDYIDSTGFEPVLVTVKCRLIMESQEIEQYINIVRKHFNPLKLIGRIEKKRKIKIPAYNKQLFHLQYEDEIEESSGA